jgi:uronate dehydrogenase
MTDVLQTKTDRPLRVLVTGSAGSVGRVVAPALAGRGHTVRGFDRESSGRLDDEHRGDLTDRAAIDRAMEGIEAVVHLAAYPNPADFVEVLVPSNVVGLYHVFEAAREAGVQRMVLASSAQAASGALRSGPHPITVDQRPTPRNMYGLAKAWAEQMGRMYADLGHFTGFAARIGWYPRDRAEAAKLESRGLENAALTHDDAARFFIHAVEAAAPPDGFAVLFAVSRSEDTPPMDLGPAERLIGYAPHDRYPEGIHFDE